MHVSYAHRLFHPFSFVWTTSFLRFSCILFVAYWLINSQVTDASPMPKSYKIAAASKLQNWLMSLDVCPTKNYIKEFNEFTGRSIQGVWIPVDIKVSKPYTAWARRALGWQLEHIVTMRKCALCKRPQLFFLCKSGQIFGANMCHLNGKWEICRFNNLGTKISSSFFISSTVFRRLLCALAALAPCAAHRP